MPQESKTTSPPVAVVSGGSSGIGKAFVAALRARGYAVVTCGRDPQKLRRLEGEYPGVECHAVDVSDGVAMRAFASDVLAAHPRIDLLISNAGGLREIDFTSENLQSLDLMAEIRSNLDGAIHLISSFLPGLKRAGRASIVIVSSGYALAPATRAPIYSASKAALHSLSKSLRRQLAPLNITVTEVAHRRRHAGRRASRRPKDVGQGRRRTDPHSGFEGRKGSLPRTGALSSPVAARRAFFRREPRRRLLKRRRCLEAPAEASAASHRTPGVSGRP